MLTADQDIAGFKPEFPPRTLEILSLIRQKGGMLCTGSCHHQKKEHLHCRQIGKALEIGFSTVWDRVNFLLKEGFIEREKVHDGPINFTITPKGENILDEAGALALGGGITCH